MATLSWPDWMPRPLQDGYSMQPEDRRIANSTVGTSFQQGFGGDVCVAEVTLQLNQIQELWFERFERDVLTQGSKWFLFPVWYSGEVFHEKCRFKTRPKISTFNGFHSTVTFSLYVQKRSSILEECLMKVFICWPPCFFFDFDSALQNVFDSLECLSEQDICAYQITYCIQECDLDEMNENFASMRISLGAVTNASLSDALSFD